MLRVTDSSNIRAIGYDPRHRTLRVRFKPGGQYAFTECEYLDVPPATFAELAGATSIGSYFATHLRGAGLMVRSRLKARSPS